MLEDLNWESLAARRTKFRLSMVYKTLHGLVAIPAEPYFTPAVGTARHSHQHALLPRHSRTEYQRNSFFVAAIPA